MDPLKLRRIADRMVELSREIYEFCEDIEKEKPKERMIDWWCVSYKEKFGRDYIVTSYDKSCGILKTLRTKLGEDGLKDLCKKYFDYDDEWVKKQAHSIEALPAVVNRIRAHQAASSLEKFYKKGVNHAS